MEGGEEREEVRGEGRGARGEREEGRGWETRRERRGEREKGRRERGKGRGKKRGEGRGKINTSLKFLFLSDVH